MEETHRTLLVRTVGSHDPGSAGGSPRLSSRLRERTKSLHARAERSGFVSEIVRGRGSQRGYALFLRNLVPAYQELERGLERHRNSPALGGVSWPDLYRAAALEHDLLVLAGAGWKRSVPLLASGERYARCVAAATGGNGERLLAHAYTRYLGDLGGGQVLKRILARSLGLGRDALSFYEFPAIVDASAFAEDVRRSIDSAAATVVDAERVIDEAEAAFRLNIELSEAIQSSVEADARGDAAATSPEG